MRHDHEITLDQYGISERAEPMRDTFIQQREMLLVCSDYGRRGVEWAGQPGLSFNTAADIAASYRNDEYVAFRRIDLDAGDPGEWSKPEDVTEEIAKAYIDQRCKELSPADDDLPFYVAQSDAWQRFCDGYADSRPPVLTQRTHGTINHAMTGVSR